MVKLPKAVGPAFPCPASPVAPESRPIPAINAIQTDGDRLKCNREQPCQNCTVRGEQDGCSFKRSTAGASLSPRGPKHGDTMRHRIDHLEGMVKRLIDQHQSILPSSNVSSEVTQDGIVFGSDSSHVGTTVIDGAHSFYKPTDDWYDVLQEVSSLCILPFLPMLID